MKQPAPTQPRIANSVVDLIGNTPLLRLARFEQAHGAQAAILAKLEYANPAGSIKDRVAYAMIRQAEADGILKPGGTIIEPTSGNTGIGLAACGAALGYRVVIVLADNLSVERRALIRHYGAELVLTPAALGMQGCIDKAQELHAATPNSFIPQQFENPANPAAHLATTAEEIWRDTAGSVDIVVAGVGTGGTICGIARGLKAHKPGVQAVAVQPKESPVLTGGAAGPHGIQGIMGGFIPANYSAELIDEVIDVSTDDAIAAAQELARLEGVNTGISSGAALAAAAILAARPEHAGKTIVAILPDTGERYLSTALFSAAG